MTLSKKLKAYRPLIILWASLLLGALTGYWLGPRAVQLKPLGDIFLNLLFTFLVPLVFFSVASAIASLGNLQKIWKVSVNMLGVFILTSLLAAIYMLVVVKLFPPAQDVFLNLGPFDYQQSVSLTDQIVGIFTVSDFIKLFSREHMLALILFSTLIGVATASLGEKAAPLSKFLVAGREVFMTVIRYVMYYAPVGFFAYFAVLTAQLGPQLFKTYYYATLTYYLAALIYFILAFSVFAFLAGKKTGLQLFWRNITLPAFTALATCSSAASIPVNLQAAENMKVPATIYEMVIPLGSLIHKDGSVLGGMMKIAFLFGIFHLSFTSLPTLMLAMVIAILVGTVMGAIPSGGLVGEMLILSAYSFPPQTLMVIAAISLLIDPPATLLNVTGNTVCSMLVARLVEGKKWLKTHS